MRPGRNRMRPGHAGVVLGVFGRGEIRQLVTRAPSQSREESARGFQRGRRITVDDRVARGVIGRARAVDRCPQSTTLRAAVSA